LLDNDDADYRTILDRYPDYGRHDIWDPHAWLEDDTYYAISGDNGIWPGKKTALYKSQDLKEWTLVGDFFHHGDEAVQGRLDCPDFFKLGDKYVLFYLLDGLEYYIGDFKNEQFYPEKHGTLSWRNGVGYAPESLLDDKGRRILWAALNDSRTHWGGLADFISKHGWCGTMTIPRVLTLDENSNLNIRPVEELEALRHGHIQEQDVRIENETKTMDSKLGFTSEIKLTMIPKGAEKFGIKVCCSPDGEEETKIWYDKRDENVRIDLTRTSLDTELMGGFYENRGLLQEAGLKLKRDEALQFHIFIDHSVLEVFVNNRLCLTQRIYPTRDDSREIVLFSEEGLVEVPVFEAWRLHPTNPW
jgi:beta-fructofuranosidase